MLTSSGFRHHAPLAADAQHVCATQIKIYCPRPRAASTRTRAVGVVHQTQASVYGHRQLFPTGALYQQQLTRRQQPYQPLLARRKVTGRQCGRGISTRAGVAEEPTAEESGERSPAVPSTEGPKYIRYFKDISMRDVPSVGGKNASLGEMYSQLSAKGVRVPNGFATTADAYRHFLAHNNLTERITDELEKLDTKDNLALTEAGARIRSWMIDAALPDDLVQELTNAYRVLEADYGPNFDVAVRSSATAEDLPDASFAGQQETYLNVTGVDNLLRMCKRVLASLFTARAISYRVDKGFDHMQVALSIGVQKMVRSDMASSGVMFTLDTESGFRDVVMVTAAYGLGENVVQGSVNPDEYIVFKPLVDAARSDGNGTCVPIIRRHLGEKAIKMIYSKDAVTAHATENVEVRKLERETFALFDDEVLELAKAAMTIEDHYSEKAGTDRPMDIEWAKDGIDGLLYVVQARPETVHSMQSKTEQDVYSIDSSAEHHAENVLCSGRSIGAKVGVGRPRVVLEASHMNELQPGEVLVTDITDPDWEPIMKIASGIVTNRGGRVCHAAIISRELGIPAIVGTGSGTAALAAVESDVTVSCCEGDVGKVYRGKLPYTKQTLDYTSTERPNTKMMLIVGNPEQAFDFAALPNDGVGLARLEFIISNHIGIHPQACLDFTYGKTDHLDFETIHAILDKTKGFKNPREFYVQRLAEGIAVIAGAFYPKPVIVRLSDFKSNEYAHLIGGEAYEPKEENPMLGFRGASRYYSDSFSSSFELECEALLRVRRDMGLTNVQVMLPFVRTVNEVKLCIAEMAKYGVVRGEDDLKVMLMCEIPANAVLAEEFLEHCDGFSIGSNDMLQLTLGADRDNELLTAYDERDPAVLAMMEMAIKAAVKLDKYVGICGQAPSDFPEITAWLVERGIKSIALQPDVLLPMTATVLATEKSLE